MQKDKEPEFVVLTTITSTGDLALIKSLLDSRNIPYFVTNENFASLFGAADGLTRMELMIRDDKLIEAKEILEDFIK